MSAIDHTSSIECETSVRPTWPPFGPMNKISHDVQLSKKLSYLLRHGAVKEKLNITAEGFVPVDEILKKITFRRCTIDDIKTVVAENEKKRFTLRDRNGIWEIKANQGHSIDEVNNLSLKQIDDPKFEIVHGTYMRCWDSIKSQGLSRMKRNHIHFAKGTNFICGLRRSAQIFIGIDFERAKKDGLTFYESENESRYVGRTSAFTYFVMAKRCEVCQIDLADEYAFQGHLTGKKHANSLKFLQLKKGIEERSIFVSNWPPYFSPNDVVDFFLQYGPMESHRFERGYALIQFANKGPVDILTNRPIVISNYRLHIKRRIFHQNKRTPNAEINDKLCYEDFKEIFEGETTFDSQLIAFLNAIQHSDVVVEGEYGSVCASLNQIFRAKFNNCRAHRYGSTVTGLSFKKSDLDVYVDIGLPIIENEDEAKPEEWTPKKVFRVAKSLLFKRKNIFTDIVLIPNAKTPIIKFRHAPTNISCDISFKNSLGVRNSNLIKYYLSLDVRLKPLMIIIKFWGQLFGISGTGKISNYALTMLIIFFLQQPERAIVPTVAELQSSCAPEFVQGWQVNYHKSNKYHQTKNDATIPELLFGFFDFYATFDLGSKVVCPLDGGAHPKTVFSKAEEFPDSMSRYKEYVIKTANPVLLYTDKPMCIQDPIELNHNLTAGISSRAVEFFQQHCITSREVCREAQSTDYKNLFSILFTKETKLEKQIKFKVSIKGEAFLKAGLPADAVLQPGVVYRGHFTIDDWYDAVFNLTKETFERVLKLEVKIGSLDREAKQQKCEAQSDVHSKDGNKIVLECSGFFKLWHGRKNKKPVFDPTLSVLDREAGISNAMVEELKKTPTSSVSIINFVCIFEKQHKPVSVDLIMKNNDSVKNVFKEFSAFITSKLPQIVDKTLLHMLQFKKVDQQSSSQASS